MYYPQCTFTMINKKRMFHNALHLVVYNVRGKDGRCVQMNTGAMSFTSLVCNTDRRGIALKSHQKDS